MVEAMRHAYMDRNTYLGDPAFVNNPLDRLLSKDYAARIRATILPDKATPSQEVQPGVAPHEKSETTHYSVIDHDGDAVAVTYTINGGFGAGVIAPGTGFFLNDEMDDFTIKPGVANLFGLVQGEANAIAPGKRPLSSMAPTLVEKDGRVVMALGSPGGSRIITTVLETALKLIDYGMRRRKRSTRRASTINGCPTRSSPSPTPSRPTRKSCSGMGYKIVVQAPWSAAEVAATAGAAPAKPGRPPATRTRSSAAGCGPATFTAPTTTAVRRGRRWANRRRPVSPCYKALAPPLLPASGKRGPLVPRNQDVRRYGPHPVSEMFPGPLGLSLAGDGLVRGLWSLEARDIREHGLGRHRAVDDTPAGGGPGMVMRADVLAASLDAALQPDDPRPRLIMSPRGAPFTQRQAREWAAGPGLSSSARVSRASTSASSPAAG